MMGNALFKFLSAVLLLVASPVISILAMIYGWGLEPKSWPWVIGGYIAMVAVLTIGEALRGDK